MKIRRLYPLAVAAALAVPAHASAAIHVVAPGETLTSVAATDGLTISELAAANGLASGSELISGHTLVIPPQSSGVVSSVGSGAVSSVGSGEPSGDDSGASAETSSAGGAYVVQRGDTLSAIAARAGTTMASLAAANGIDPNGLLISGTVLRLSGLAAASSTASSSVAQTQTAPQQVGSNAPPYPTRERVNSGEVSTIAANNGVPASFASAIGWQESGFNNALVSSADARGVMQIIPGTWSWIQHNLAGGSLAPASAQDNVRGGVLLLHSLLSATGGNRALAAAGYYQGLASVRRSGLYSDTRQYVNSVLALQSRFGG